MNLAQQGIAALADWIRASSQSHPAPVFGFVEVGPWAVLVPSALDAAPAPGFDAEALPLWFPQAQAPASLPTIDTATPACQGRMADRLSHLLWALEDRRFPGVAAVGLDDPQETLQVAINRAGMGGIDLTVTPLLCAPLWALPADNRDTISWRLPFQP